MSAAAELHRGGRRSARLIYAAGGMVGETGRPLATFPRYDARARRVDDARAAAGADARLRRALRSADAST